MLSRQTGTHPLCHFNSLMSAPTIQEGTFTYIETAHHIPQSNQPNRKTSDGEEDIQGPVKRPPTQQLQIKEYEYSGILYAPGGASPYSLYIPTPTSSSVVYGGTDLAELLHSQATIRWLQDNTCLNIRSPPLFLHLRSKPRLLTRQTRRPAAQGLPQPAHRNLQPRLPTLH